jgi:hypothetical protein
MDIFNTNSLIVALNQLFGVLTELRRTRRALVDKLRDASLEERCRLRAQNLPRNCVTQKCGI